MPLSQILCSSIVVDYESRACTLEVLYWQVQEDGCRFDLTGKCSWYFCLVLDSGMYKCMAAIDGKRGGEESKANNGVILSKSKFR